MKILACFKIVHDFERITPAELIALRDGALSISTFKRQFGSYDEAALENARRLAVEARKNGDCQLDAATVGECEPRFAQDLYALGFDRVFQIRASQKDAAANLCRLIEAQGGYDVILTGRQAWPDESGLTPYWIAKRLSLPCIAQVIDLEQTPGGVRVVSQTDGGTFVRTITVSAVYSIAEAKHSYLQIATLREKLATRDKRVHEIAGAPVEAHGGGGEHLRLLYESTEKQCRFLEGETVDEKACALWREVFSDV